MSGVKRSRIDLEGQILAISHVFYLKGEKCFFLRLKSGDVEVNVIVPIKRSQFLFLQHGNMNHINKMTSITKLSLLKDDLYQVSSRSEIQVCDSQTENDPVTSVFGGVVTDDAHASSGVYTLNEKVTLVTTALCHVTNIRKLAKGCQILVSNAHLIRNEETRQIFLVLCARSQLKIEGFEVDDNEVKSSVHHKKDTEEFGEDSVVDLTLKLNLHFKDILTILNFRDALGSDLVKNEDRLNRLEMVVKNLEILEKNFEIPFRSLVKEFTEPCRGKCSTLSAPRIFKKDFHFVSKGMKLVNEKLIEEETLRRDCYRNHGSIGCDYVSIYVTNVPLIGAINFSEISGQIELRSDEASVPICSASDLFHLSDQKVLVQEYHAVKEWINNGESTEVTYLMIARIKLLCDINKETKVLEEPLEVAQVIDHSGPIHRKESWHYLITIRPETSRQLSFMTIETQSLQTKVLPMSMNQLTISKRSESENISYSQIGQVTRFYKNSSSKVSEYSSGKIVPKVSKDISEENFYTLDKMSEIPENEMVSVQGIIAEKWVENAKFANENGTQNNFTHIPSNVTVQIKLQCSGSSELCSFYLSHWQNHPFPLGLLPKKLIVLHNVAKIRSKKGSSYLVSTPMTRFSIASKTTEDFAPTESLIFVREFTGKFTAIVTVESITRLSITAICGACNNQLFNGVCMFSGCHSVSSVEFQCKVNLIVEDGTCSANLFSDDLNLAKSVLKLNDKDWKYLLDKVQTDGELVYLSNDRNNGYQGPLNDFVAVMASVVPVLESDLWEIMCRPLKCDNFDELPRLYCLNAKKLS